MNNEPSHHANFFSTSIMSAFTTATKASEASQQYISARHHHVQKPRHGLDYTRVHFNVGPRDDGRAPMMVPAW
ncbi:MAG TPA: hypothetical protein VEF76_03130 [Patescibacteria group bacterium]|nr:hypothetical protein [Patescibacteria group bacterium]